ncbi:MAG: dephospho-CoA kinase [Deltaproteobacteria bacterium]
MLRIAVTGAIGSGKSTVLAALARRGAAVMSCDAVVRRELADNRRLQAALRRMYGEGIFHAGRLSRRRLARLVFSDPARVAALNRRVHPIVKRGVRAFFRKNRARRYAAVEVPLLFETDFYKLFDVTIGVAIGERLRRRRLREHGAAAEAARRMRWQLSARKKLARCDFIIDNSGTRKEAYRKVKKLMEDVSWLKK